MSSCKQERQWGWPRLGVDASVGLVEGLVPCKDWGGGGWGGEETTTMRILHNPNDIKDVVI
jgi:hypothetical protein